MQPNYDAIVLGSGVGGSCAAALLAQALAELEAPKSQFQRLGL